MNVVVKKNKFTMFYLNSNKFGIQQNKLKHIREHINKQQNALNMEIIIVANAIYTSTQVVVRHTDNLLSLRYSPAFV